MRENQVKQYVLYDGNVVLEFDEAAHKYYIQKEDESIAVPSTTAVIEEVIAKHALKFWAVNETLKWIKTQLIAGTRITGEQVDAIISSAKFVHVRKSDDATGIGSNVHNWIEDFVRLVMEDGVKWPEDWKVRVQVPLMSRDAIRSANAFLNWYEQHEVTFVMTEKKVYSVAYNYSGTFDLLAIVDGKLSLIDFKTSKNIYPDYLVQGAAYWNAFIEEYPGVEVEQFIVLRLPKDGTNWESSRITDFRNHFEIFKLARQLYEWVEKDNLNINPEKETSSVDTVQYLN